MDWRKLKIGDKIVKVRGHYQNYDHTKVPCEPKIYTIKWSNGSEKSMEEDVQRPFWHSSDKTIYGGTASGWSNSQIHSDCETYEDYISGNYNKDIILDPMYKGDLGKFLEVKRIEDHKRAEEIRVKTMKELKEKYKGQR